MSIVAMSAVFAAVAELSMSEKAVLFVLAWHANDAGEQCWPSQETIAREAGGSIRNVQRILDDPGSVKGRGLLTVLEPARQHRSARYAWSFGAVQTDPAPGVETSQRRQVVVSGSLSTPVVQRRRMRHARGDKCDIYRRQLVTRSVSKRP